MEKIKETKGTAIEVIERMLIKQDEIIDWINKNKEAIEWVNEFQKMFYDAFEQILLQYQAKGIIDKAQKPKILRYELSHDKAGLIAHLAGGASYHIHSDELTPDQIIVKNQLLEMEGK